MRGKGGDDVKGITDGRKKQGNEVNSLDVVLENVSDAIFINEIEPIVEYLDTFECMITITKIESMNDDPEAQEKRIQPLDRG